MRSVTLDEELMAFIRRANEHNVPVYLTTEKEWEADLAALDAWHDHPS